MIRSRRAPLASSALALALATGGCDGLTSSSRDRVAPIELRGEVTIGPTGGGGYRVQTDYCECVSDTLTLVDGRDNLTRIQCTGVYGLHSAGGDEPVEATILGPGWRVSHSVEVLSSPHVGVRIDATCREP